MVVAVSSRANLATLPPSDFRAAVLTEQGREGPFVWSSANHSDGSRAITNRINTSTKKLPDGFTRILKTEGAVDYDASAPSIAGAPADFTLRVRALGGTFIFMGVSADPSATDDHVLDYDMQVSGAASIVATHINGSTQRQVRTFDNEYDHLWMLRRGGVITVHYGPNLDLLTLVDTFPGTNNATLYFDSSIYNVGEGFEAMFVAETAAGTGRVSADPEQAMAVAPATDTTGASGAWLRVLDGPLKPEMFGASPAAANNTDAIHALGVYLSRMNGGTVEFAPGATYLVGEQTLGIDSRWSYKPTPLLDLQDISGGVHIFGNGATLKCANGLKYGAFNRTTGAAIAGVGTNSQKASPLAYFIHWAAYSTGSLIVENLNVHGNIENAVIGGGIGDAGIQVDYNGFEIKGPGSTSLINCNSTSCGFDGLQVHRPNLSYGSTLQPLKVDNCVFAYSGRQGLSWTSGRGGQITNSRFEFTGRAINAGTGVAFGSNPRAGIDIEPDAPAYGDEIIFDNIECSRNDGDGFLAQNGRSSRILIRGGRLIGDYSWAFTFQKPSVRMENVLVIGAGQSLSMDDPGNDIPASTYGFENGYANDFENCQFLDAPGRTPSGQVYLGAESRCTLLHTTRLRNCKFFYENGMEAPNVDTTTEFHDCLIAHTAASSQTAGTFYGFNRLTGAFPNLASSRLYGRVILNDVEQFLGTKVHNFGALAAGATATTTVTVPGAAIGDGRVYSVQGLRAAVMLGKVYPTAANAVEVVVHSPAGDAGGSGTLEVRGAR